MKSEEAPGEPSAGQHDARHAGSIIAGLSRDARYDAATITAVAFTTVLSLKTVRPFMLSYIRDLGRRDYALG